MHIIILAIFIFQLYNLQNDSIYVNKRYGIITLRLREVQTNWCCFQQIFVLDVSAFIIFNDLLQYKPINVFKVLCRLQVLSLIISNFQSQHKTIIVIYGTVRGFRVSTIIVFNELSKCWFRVFEIKCPCWP